MSHCPDILALCDCSNLPGSPQRHRQAVPCFWSLEVGWRGGACQHRLPACPGRNVRSRALFVGAALQGRKASIWASGLTSVQGSGGCSACLRHSSADLRMLARRAWHARVASRAALVSSSYCLLFSLAKPGGRNELSPSKPVGSLLFLYVVACCASIHELCRGFAVRKRGGCQSLYVCARHGARAASMLQ